MNIDENLQNLLADELMDDDFDVAFQLQMQEVVSVSLSPQFSSSTAASSSSNPPLPPPNDAISLLAEEMEIYEQERSDRELAESETKQLSENLNRLIHDQAFARDILNIPEAEWKKTGEDFHRPYYGEGSTSWTAGSFRVYFKGLVKETVGDTKMTLAGVGLVICDMSDCPIFEMKKPLALAAGEASEDFVEFQALMEGLNAAVTLGLKRVNVFFDSNPLYQYVTGKGPPRQNRILTLVDQVSVIQRKFTSCNSSLVGQNEVRFAFKLARDAIISQATQHGKILVETCTICTEDTDVGQMFTIDNCLHQYCVSCMKRSVEAKLLLGMLPECPHEGCKTEMKLQSCKNFLTPELYYIMSQRIKEASIPATEKIYCPFPSCSALMSKSEVQGYAVNLSADAQQAGARKCMTCHDFFCVNCKVPWHVNMTCFDYKKQNPHPSPEEAKLKSLAIKSRWRQCEKCSHMVELAQGCYHIYCRCGYEFCYTCGGEWKNKKATCNCPIWDERNILYAERNRRRQQ